MHLQSERDDKHSESVIVHYHLEGDSGKGNVPDKCVLVVHKELHECFSKNEQRPPRSDRALEALKP